MTAIIAWVLSLAGPFAVSHIGGRLVGVVLGRFGLGGFGPLAWSVMKRGRLLRRLYNSDPTERTRAELAEWVAQNDPGRRLPVSRGIETTERGPVDGD